MTKEDIIKRIDEQSPTLGEVKTWLRGISHETKVDRIKKGDVIVHRLYKNRPLIVAKVTKSVAYCIPMTTTLDELTLNQFNSRIFGKKYFSLGIVPARVDIAKKSFIGVLDDPKSLNKAIELIKLKINKL